MKYHFYFDNIEMTFWETSADILYQDYLVKFNEPLSFYSRGKIKRKEVLDFTSRIPHSSEFHHVEIALQVDRDEHYSLNKYLRPTSEEFNEDYVKSILGEQTVDIDLRRLTKITDDLYIGKCLICAIKDKSPTWIKIGNSYEHTVFKNILCVGYKHVRWGSDSRALLTMDINTHEYEITEQ